MLIISKPLSASQAQAYHRQEFANAHANYYSDGETIRGEWHGKLADQWGLRGTVDERYFARLAQGQHPITGEKLVRHKGSCKYANDRGEKITTMNHRAGWDATFSAPKSVSLTALVGGDDDVRQAHRESVRVALDELETYVQARMGGNRPAETTGKWVAASFEHDSARPVNGYAAPQLHTHVVFFNLTETVTGETRALQPHELYRSQQYGTAIYRSELALRLRKLGYEIERGRSCQPEIKGYTQEYLEVSSPRSQQIKEHLEQLGLRGAAAAQIAAHQTRQEKLPSLTHKEMQQNHQEIAAHFGNPPQRIVREARERPLEEQNPTDKSQSIELALKYAREKNLECQAVVDERELLRDSLRRSMGHASFAEVRDRLEECVRSRDLIEVESKNLGRAFTTDRVIAYKRDTIAIMRASQNQHSPLVSLEARSQIHQDYGHLSGSQRAVVEQILSSQDKITGLEGEAGAGKATALAAIREAVEREGYEVRGLALSSRAAHRLAESGIESGQHHLRSEETPHCGKKRFYILDESTFASTKEVNEFLRRLQSEDRVLVVGDKRKHDAMEADGPCGQLHMAGMQTARLGEILRQKDPVLKEAAERLARDLCGAIEGLERHGCVHEIADRTERLAEISHAYTSMPEGTIAISPDNETRRELNAFIRHEMQKRGDVSRDERKLFVFDSRDVVTGAARQWARQYEAGDVVRYARGSKVLGIDPGEYARVENVDNKENRITIERENGERQTYDPRRISGVVVYQQVERGFSEGDRVQFTAPSKELHVANRELGTIEKINDAGDIQIHMDSGRDVHFNIREHAHLDYGYAVTSHRNQGQTAERVLIHVDTSKGEQLVNSRFAYVSITRGRCEVQIYTDDWHEIARDLSRDLAGRTATEGEEQELAAQKVQLGSERHEMQGHKQPHAHGIGLAIAE